jgi:hypothetical protein
VVVVVVLELQVAMVYRLRGELVVQDFPAILELGPQYFMLVVVVVVRPQPLEAILREAPEAVGLVGRPAQLEPQEQQTQSQRQALAVLDWHQVSLALASHMV